MMPLRPCLTCGTLTTGSYCPKHDPRLHKVTSPTAIDRPSPTLRRRIKKRDGNRCVRCGSTENLRVHHLRQVADGGGHEEANLVTLCADCHGAVHGP
jgi:5-methylcytosine-specific restriction endonuclease McrA